MILTLAQHVLEWTRGSIRGGAFWMDAERFVNRPPSTRDLNSAALEGIYDGLEKTRGQMAATNFVRFVNQLDDLSARAFIIAFERFYESGFEDIWIVQRAEDSGGPPTWLSPDIKGDFIRLHREEIPEKERRELAA